MVTFPPFTRELGVRFPGGEIFFDEIDPFNPLVHFLIHWENEKTPISGPEEVAKSIAICQTPEKGNRRLSSVEVRFRVSFWS